VRGRPARRDARWLPVLDRLGYADMASYLTQRHVVQYQSVNAIAAEVGMSRHAVGSALRRHGLAPTAHAGKRHAASERAARVAARVGFGSIADYVLARRAAGWTWRAMSAESGQPQSWLRRQAKDAQAGPR
jgi:protein-disulfide isomerase-like protein with CxxC motif